MNSVMNRLRVPGSFRDPSGVVFTQDGDLYRQIQHVYAPQYRRLMDSGLYRTLVDGGLLVPHAETERLPAGEDGYLVIRPERVPFISYPYEWSFSQLRDAALATLRIHEKALDHGMVLKDASAYNIQFHHGKPLLIDTLSFDAYREGDPWIAYRQFCQHFLAPLALMHYTDQRLAQLLRVHIDGIPLDLAAKILPGRARWRPGLFMHLFMHANYQQRYAGGGVETAQRLQPKISMLAMRGLIDSLRGTVLSMRPPRQKGVWTEYYDETNYTREGLEHKRQLIDEYLAEAAPDTLWDLGANNGHFSRLASRRGIATMAFDYDITVVEACYRRCTAGGERHLLPLFLDLANPSPGLGWAHVERSSLLERGPAHAVMALALVHHLAIGNNVPLGDIAAFFRRCGHTLIVEFVPREDSQVQHLLASREDIFSDYTREGFEAAFAEHFSLRRAEPIRDSQRILYLMEARPV